jgi:SAM-dependent methyltransferase
MKRPDRAPEGIDIERPSVARVYDYALGGSHNFAADRALFRQLTTMIPDLRPVALANRAFLHRALRFLLAVGVRQFLDIGSGIPTRGNVHEVAGRAAPDARVVYVDVDPVAVAHSREILVGNDRAGVIQEDLRRPERILAHSDTRRLLDVGRPLAVLLMAVAHLVPDDDELAGAMAVLRDAVAPGSYLVISHPAVEGGPAALAKGVQVLQGAGIAATARTREQVAGLFGDFELVDPGLVWLPQWRPDGPDDGGEHPLRSLVLAGVGRKR